MRFGVFVITAFVNVRLEPRCEVVGDQRFEQSTQFCPNDETLQVASTLIGRTRHYNEKMDHPEDADRTIPPSVGAGIPPSGGPIGSRNRSLDVTADSSSLDPRNRATELDSRSWAGAPIRGELGKGTPHISARYKIISQLGEGGFGVVYLADQTEPVRRRVALKLMKMAFASPSMLARFEAEQQALAIMDHPGLAKVFDAGTNPEGQPYFAMEYAPGEPLASFCDKRKLDIPTRVRLLAQVCDAVHHAHMKGVVHRDLKPGNILVGETDEGFRAKVIDFGIAKAISAGAAENVMETQFGQFVGTPVYMSPEQAEGGTIDIDTRSDIYSIGVILYELLVSKTPIESETFRRSGLVHLYRTIMDTEPLRPSSRLETTTPEERKSITEVRQIDFGQLERVLKRDLDWITMRCLEKDRTRRYESASGLAADLRRYLDGEAVLAGPPTARYRLGKFVRRNRMAVGSGAFVAIGLVVFAIVMGVLWRDANRQKQRAVQTLDVFLSSLKPSNVSGTQSASATTVQEYLRMVEKESDSKLQDQPDIANDVREVIGPVFTSLADYDSAARTMSQSVTYRRALALDGNTPNQVALAHALHEYGRALFWMEKLDESKVAYEEALEIRRSHLTALDPLTAQTMTHLSMVYCASNQLALSDQLGNESVALMRKIDNQEGEELSRTLFSRATTLCRAKRFDEARGFAEESVQLLLKKHGPNDWRLGRNLGLLADIELASKRPELAVVHQRQVIELLVPRFGLNHPTVTAARHKLGETLCLLATGTIDPKLDTPILDAALLDEAMRSVQLAIDGRRLEANFPLNLATSLSLLSRLHAIRGEYDSAIALEQQVIKLLHEKAPHAADQVNWAQERLKKLEVRRSASRQPPVATEIPTAIAPNQIP